VYLIAGQYIKCLVAQLLVARPSTPAMHHRWRHFISFQRTPCSLPNGSDGLVQWLLSENQMTASRSVMYAASISLKQISNMFGVVSCLWFTSLTYQYVVFSCGVWRNNPAAGTAGYTGVLHAWKFCFH
jgi:hypothetical protein